MQKRQRSDSIAGHGGLRPHVTLLYQAGDVKHPYRKLIELFEDGASDSYAGRVMGVDRKTIKKWRPYYKPVGSVL